MDITGSGSETLILTSPNKLSMYCNFTTFREKMGDYNDLSLNEGDEIDLDGKNSLRDKKNRLIVVFGANVFVLKSLTHVVLFAL